MTHIYRSMLFVPGQRPTWVDKAVAVGPDALILDLEDAVPEQEKDAARSTVADSVRRIGAGDSGIDMWVRPNSWDSDRAGLDLESVVVPGLRGLVLPKLDSAEDVVRFDALTRHYEIRNGLAPGSVMFIASLETPRGMADCEAIATAVPRVVSLIGATARDADTGRALGFEWTPEGLETLYLRSRILLAGRAAGHQMVICGMWQDIHDLEGLERFSMLQRQLGYDGQMVIHPSHVAIVNSVYSLPDERRTFYEGLIDAFRAAESQGAASTSYDGQHIDRAHYETALAVVARHPRTR